MSEKIKSRFAMLFTGGLFLIWAGLILFFSALLYFTAVVTNLIDKAKKQTHHDLWKLIKYKI